MKTIILIRFILKKNFMKFKIILIFVSLSFFCLGDSPRVFTSKDNTRKITATLIDFNPNSNNVTIKRVDGKVFNTHVLKFSLQDRIFIAQSYKNQVQALFINRPNIFVGKRNPLNKNICILTQPHLGNIMADNLCNPKLMNYHDYGTIVRKMNEKFVARQAQPRIIHPAPRARIINQPRPTTIIMPQKFEPEKPKKCVLCPIRR